MRSFIILLFLSCATFSTAQVNLTVLPKAERDSMLVKIVQDYLLRKFPDRYREDIFPTFSEGDFRICGEKWLLEKYFPSKQLPPQIKPKDIWYEVILYYKYWEEAKWDSPYTIRARIVGKTGELYEAWLGTFGYKWPELYELPDVISNKRRPSTLPRDERDSILIDIAQKTVKKEWPELYREPTYPVVEQYDFSIRRLDWMLQDFAVPDYVNPEDLYYVVTLYYENWEKEDDFFSRPYIAKIYIVEKTREAYKIESGAFGVTIRSLLKSQPEE